MARVTQANTYGERLRRAAFEAVCRGWPLVPGGFGTDSQGTAEGCSLRHCAQGLSMPTGVSSPPERQAGRHRRARLGWWRPQLGAVVKVTVAELVRRRERERAYAGRARRVRVVPRQRPAPDTTATSRVTVGYQGSMCPTCPPWTQR